MFDPNKTRITGADPRMPVKTLAAKTLSECLLLARDQIGPDAVILNTKTVKKGAFLGRWGGRDMVQVEFGIDQQAASESPAPVRRRRPAPRTMPSSPVVQVQEPDERLPGMEAAALQRMEAQIADLTSCVQNLAHKIQKSEFVAKPLLAMPFGSQGHKEQAPEEPYEALRQRLTEAEIAAPLARRLVAELPSGLDAADAAAYMRDILSRRLQLAGIDAPAHGGVMPVQALVGSTGGGKTTTLVKLAARYALTERRRVGVVTLDTQRFAAPQQLQSFGEIIKVPVRLAYNQADLISHLGEFAHEKRDIVLLDTAGLSPGDAEGLEEIAAHLAGIENLQTLLCLPATLATRDMDHTITRFRSLLSPHALVLTKTDEAADHACYGKLLSMQAKHGLPLAYVTNGQWVPDDIALPDAHAIATRLLSSTSV